MILNRTTKAILLLVIMIISLCSCTASYSNQINIGIDSKAVSLDPQLASSSSELMAVRNMFEGLMRYDSDGKLLPAAAKEYKQNGKEFIFYLRDDLTWSDGTPVTANDFVFAFRRAVDPATEAPFSHLLSDIVNAKEIINKKMTVSELAVYATDDYTLKIILTGENTDFLEQLTNAVFMPCNENFFKKCAGKYGRDKSSTISNGSYRLNSWDTESDTIKLIRNKKYNGNFYGETSNLVIQYLSIDERLEKFRDSGYDIVIVDSGYEFNDDKKEYKQNDFENTVWLMVYRNTIPDSIKLSFTSVIDFEDILSEINAFKYTDILFPNADFTASPLNKSENPQKLFSDTVKNQFNAKVPIYKIGYVDTADMKSISSAVATTLQSKLGAFVNISPFGSAYELINSDSDILLYPIKSTDSDYSALPDRFTSISNFACISQNSISSAKNYLIDNNVAKAQEELLSNGNIIPFAFSNQSVVYTEALTVYNITIDNGYIDFYASKKKYE